MTRLREFFYPNSFKIIAGDLNCSESTFDKFGGNSSPSTYLKDFRTLHGFVDVWRSKNGCQLHCTWFNSHKTIGSHLDKFPVAHDHLFNNFFGEISRVFFLIMILSTFHLTLLMSVNRGREFGI